MQFGGFFDRIMQSIRRFMVGRHGVDQFTIALLVLGMVLSLLSSIFRWYWLVILYWVVIAYCFFRVLSRNHTKRYAENQRFMTLWAPVSRQFAQLPKKMEQRKLYLHFKCPHCGQKLRLPRGRGLVAVTCSRCHTEFQKKS